jgi:hypothetical protein
MSATERQRYAVVRTQVEKAILEVKPLADGYGFRLASESAHVLAAAEFITLERRCCPFFHFTLEVEPNLGPVWLKLTGEGVKDFVRDQLKPQGQAKPPNRGP